MFFAFLLYDLSLVIKWVRHVREVASETGAFTHLTLLGRVGEEVSWLNNDRPVLCLSILFLLDKIGLVFEICLDLPLKVLRGLEILVMACLFVAFMLGRAKGATRWVVI